ncbi:MAG: carbohydrate ABC transporter permease [Nitrososphaeria archaeon]
MKFINFVLLTFKYILLLICAAFALLPPVWMLLTSVRLPVEYFAKPPTFTISNPTFLNYFTVLQDPQFQLYYVNSIFVSLTTATLWTLVSILAGFAFARFSFKFKTWLFIIIVFCQMVPLMSLITPLYYIFSRINMLDNLIALPLLYAINVLPFAVWMSRATFTYVPTALEDAAQVDGCSYLQAIFLVSIRVAAPSIAAIFAFCFIEAWNEYVLAMTFINSVQNRTVQIGIMLYRGFFGTEWGKLMAASTIASLPIVILFVYIQKYLVSGLSYGAVKG